MDDINKISEALGVISYFSQIENKDELAKKIHRIYNDIDVIKELFKMEFWLDINSTRRKKDYRRFIFNWLNRAHQKKQSIEQMKKFDRGYKDERVGYKQTKQTYE